MLVTAATVECRHRCAGTEARCCRGPFPLSTAPGSFRPVRESGPIPSAAVSVLPYPGAIYQSSWSISLCWDETELAKEKREKMASRRSEPQSQMTKPKGEAATQEQVRRRYLPAMLWDAPVRCLGTRNGTD